MNDLLKALAESDRNLEAPPAVEARLRAAFRKKHRRHVWPYLAVAAALMAALLIPRPKAQTMEITVLAPSVVSVPTPKLRPVVHRHPEDPREIVTQFFPLMEDEPFEKGELVRVSLPAIAMRNVGLPVSEEHLTDMVQADVLVGEEGLARAIRFVTLEMN
jgi:hypothetical protein